MASAARRTGASLSMVLALLLVGCGENGDSSSIGAEKTEPRKPSGSGEELKAGRREHKAYRAFVAVEDESAVVVLKGPPWRLTRRTRVAAGPHNASASANGRYVAVSSPPAGGVTILDARGRVVSRTQPGAGAHDVAFTSDGGLWVTAEDAGRIVKLEVPSGRPLRSRATAGPPHDLDVSPDGRELWVTIDGSQAVEVRSAKRGRLLDRPTLGDAPHDVAFTPAGDRLWFSNWFSSKLTVASARGRERIGSLTAGTEPHHFAFGMRSLWATDNEGGRLLRIDPASRLIRGQTRVGPEPHHPAVAGPHVLVAVHGSGQLAVVSREGRLVRRVGVGAGPHGVAAMRLR